MNKIIKVFVFSFLILSIAGNLLLLLAQTPDRSKLPELGPPPSLKLPPMERFNLNNGLEVIFMAKHDVPLIQMIVMIHSGEAMVSRDKLGLATLTFDMMDEGAGERNTLQLADEIEFLGARIGVSAGLHTGVGSLYVPATKFEEALSLLADIIQRPTFPVSELERLKKERLTRLMQMHDEPRAIASYLFDKVLYGDKHPYGSPLSGNEKSIRSITTDNLKKFHSEHVNAGNATIIVVGATTKEELMPKLESAFGSWSRRETKKIKWPPIAQVDSRNIFLVDKPDAAQSEIRIGRIGVDRKTEDFFPIIVMNTILGGAFTSRLNQNLREQHGYSYGASSTFDMRPLPGPFLAASAVQTDVTDKALVEFFKELRGILELVSDEELERAKNYVAYRYPSDFQTVSQIAQRITHLVTHNLPDSYFNDYIGNALAVTKEDVLRVARKYIDPEKMAIIVVGEKKKIEKGVSGLNLGNMKVMTIGDVLGKPPKL